jgi:hypothetical protein
MRVHQTLVSGAVIPAWNNVPSYQPQKDRHAPLGNILSISLIQGAMQNELSVGISRTLLGAARQLSVRGEMDGLLNKA